MSVNKVNSDGSLSRVAGGTLYADAPIGTISPFGGSTIPNGYLLCDGAEVLKTTYAELYAVIGDAFGIPSDNTKFVLPDMRETVPVGSGTRGSGVATHDLYGLGQFKDDQMQSHTHGAVQVNGVASFGIVGDPSWSESAIYSATVSGTSNNTISLSAGANNGRTGTTTHGKQLGVNYIIKAKQVAVPFDVKAYMSPDYANITQISTSTSGSYTVEEDGFIDAQVLSSSGTSYIKINGGLVATNGNQSANNYAISLHHFGKVSQGDVIEWLGSHNAGVYIAFVPHK